jgi:hypothetical protein
MVVDLGPVRQRDSDGRVLPDAQGANDQYDLLAEPARQDLVAAPDSDGQVIEHSQLAGIDLEVDLDSNHQLATKRGEFSIAEVADWAQQVFTSGVLWHVRTSLVVGIEPEYFII